MKYPCLIIDDEPLARRVIRNYLSKLPEFDPITEFDNAEDALTHISKHPIPLIFLDINMPEITGLEMAKMLPKTTEVIFTTAYSQHAVEGFSMEVLDYLVKPIPYPRFLQAIRRFKEKHTKENQFYFIKDGSQFHKIALDDIFYVEGMKDYVKIHTADKSYIQHQTMKNMEEILPPNKFMRVHRSYIINYTKIKSYYASELIIEDKKIPVGQVYKTAVTDLLDSNLLK